MKNTLKFGEHLKMTERKIGWLAGIVDGEGYIAIHKLWANDRNNYRFQVRLVVSNTNFDICQRCKDLCGCGKVYTKKQVKGQKVVYQWVLYGVDKIVSILEMIKDDLIQKKEVAEIVIRYKKFYQSKGGYAKRISPETLQSQYLLYHAALELNRRGNSEPSPNREGVETRWESPEKGEGIVRATRRRVESGRNIQTVLETE